MPTLFIRAPFEPGASSSTQPFSTAEDPEAIGQLKVTVDPSDLNRLKLLPIFPGVLTFKPLAPLESDKPVIGTLYLEIAPYALIELAKLLPDLNYPFLMIYHGVLLSDAFFAGTVKNALIATVRPGMPTATDDQKKDAFKRGLLSVNIKPGKKTANCTLPVVQKKSASNQHLITIELGVRMTDNPYALPSDLTLTAVEPADIVDPSKFLPVPIAYFYKALRGLTNARWAAVSADGHKAHPFYDALDELEQAVPPALPERWRRLRLFTSADRKALPGCFSAAMSDVTVRAGSSSGMLWSQNPVNALGEIFVRRPDNEAFTVEVLQKLPPTHPLPVSAPPPVACQIAPFPTGAAADSLSRTWAPPSPDRPPPNVDIRAEINFDGDPLLDPLTKLEDGMEDMRGLTVIKPTKHTSGRVIAYRHLIVPLQKQLANFGFGSTKTPSRLFNVTVRQAVREFQREAKMTAVNGQPSRMSGGSPVDAASITPFAGMINGVVDIPTLIEMRVWREKDYRAALNFNIVRGATIVQDVGYADANSLGWEILMAPSRPLGISTRFQTYHGVANVIRPADIDRGRKPSDELSDPARAARYVYLKTWEKRLTYISLFAEPVSKV